MNHWAIGHLDKNHKITLPLEVLRPISINQGVMVWGMFYPFSPYPNNNSSIKMDFVFSSIPYYLWPKTAQITIRTFHEPGTFKEISKVLHENNTSIIVSDVSRSSHSYDTWRIIASCDDLNVNSNQYDPIRREYIGMANILKKN